MTSKRNAVAIFVLGFLLKIVTCEEITNQQNLSVSSTDYSKVETTENAAKEPLYDVLNLDAPTNETLDTKLETANPISNEPHKIQDDKVSVSVSTLSTNTIKSTLPPTARKVEEYTPYPFRRLGAPGDHSWSGLKPANNSIIRTPVKSTTTQTVMTIRSIDSHNATVPTLKDVNKRQRKTHRRHRHHHRNAHVKPKPKAKITEATTKRHRPIKQHPDNKHGKSHSRKSARGHHNSQYRRHHVKNDGEHNRKKSNLSHYDQTDNIKEERSHKPLYREKFSRSKRSVKHSLKEPTTSKATDIPYELTNNNNKSVEHMKKDAISPVNDEVNDLVGERKLQKTSAFASHLKNMIARLRKTFDPTDSNTSNTKLFMKYNHSMHELMQTKQKSHKSDNNTGKDVIKEFLLGGIITSLSSELQTMNHSDAAFHLESPLEGKKVDGTTDLLIDAKADNVVKHISYPNPLQVPITESHLKQRSIINDTLRQSKTWLDGPFYRALFSENRKKRDVHIIEEVNGTWSTTSTTEKKSLSLSGEDGFFPLDLDTSYPNKDIHKVICPHSVFVINLEHKLKNLNTANDNTEDLINEIVPFLLDEAKSFRNDQTALTKYQIKEMTDIIKQKSQILSNNVPAPDKLIYVDKMNNLENNVVKHLAGFFPKMYRMSKSSKSTVIKEDNSSDDIKRTDELRRPVYMTLSILLDVLAVFTLFVILYFYLRSNGYCYRVVMIDRRIPKIKINFDRADQKDANHHSGMNVNLINTP